MRKGHEEAMRRAGKHTGSKQDRDGKPTRGVERNCAAESAKTRRAPEGRRPFGMAVRVVLAFVLCVGLMPSFAVAADGTWGLFGSGESGGAVVAGGVVSVQADGADADDGTQNASEDEAARKAAEEEAARRAAEEEAARKAAEEEAARKAAEEEEAARRAAEEEAARKAAEEEAAQQQGQGQQGTDQDGAESGTDPNAGGGGTDSAGSTEPVATTLSKLYLFYQNYDKPDRPLAYNPKSNPLISQDKGTMQLYAQSEFTSGAIGWVADTGVGVVWSIERTYDDAGAETNKQIAEIDRADGTVRALGQGNGQVIVRCQARNYEVYADIPITIKGNSDVPYLIDLQICDDTGRVCADDAEIRVESEGFGLERKFFAQATYHDPTSGSEFVLNTKNGDVIPGISWTTSGDEKVAYVNPDTGVFIAQGAGSVRLTCSVAGAGLLGDTISDYVFVLCGGDTLDAERNYTPADELKVVVKYATEDKQGIGGEADYETARTWYYSPAELEALGVTENLYTLVKSSGTWGTMKARGVYFQRLLEDVINAPEFDLSMVKGFYFGSTDAYNPGFVGEEWLFTQRYYYPNMSVGSGRLGAVGVAPMIATSTVQEDLVDEPAGELSTQTRFRLCLGAESTTVNNAQQSIYNIYQITVILEGAPPVGWDDPNNGHAAAQPSAPAATSGGDSGSGSSSGGNGGQSTGGGDSGGTSAGGDSGSVSEDSGAASGGQDGETTVTPSAAGDETPDPAATAAAQAPGASSTAIRADEAPAQATSGVSASAAAAQQATAEASEASEQVDATEQAIRDMLGDEEHRYQVYEMMSKQPALVEALQLENPLAPFVLPGLLLVLVAGALRATLRFRREMGAGAPGKVLAVMVSALIR